jgi:hypothetical protein
MRHRIAFGSALALVAVVACSVPEAPEVAHGLPFVENDWPGALAAARERGVPLFIEAWAPW